MIFDVVRCFHTDAILSGFFFCEKASTSLESDNRFSRYLAITSILKIGKLLKDFVCLSQNFFLFKRLSV